MVKVDTDSIWICLPSCINHVFRILGEVASWRKQLMKIYLSQCYYACQWKEQVVSKVP